ncbi:MAG: alpha/beta hydrolase [Betaproteobacteria bacterium]|nr:alpha/beta hydrolase [Betaproteobacteria bacterium]
MNKPALRLLVVLLAWPLAALAQQEVREIPTRPGVTVRFIYTRAEQPVASAVLLQGGSGAIGIYPNGSTNSTGFLATGAARFASNGISVVVPDTPSDRRNLHDFRATPEHAEDIAALIAYLRQQSTVPVWAVGTSNGSLSAASAAATLKERGPDGIVLTAAVTRPLSAQAHLVTDAPLGEVRVPALLVHHRSDGCAVTPYDAMPALLAALKASRKAELITVDGGERGSGTPCGGGHHQFLGIEEPVTQAIAEWIRRHPPSR